MSTTMYQLSIVTFTRMLTNLDALLEKAESHAQQRKFDGAVLAEARLFPDMFPLKRQVQIACDFAKGCSARLAGLEVPRHEDTESTLAQLRARIAKTLEFVRSVSTQQLAGAETRIIVHPIRTMTVELEGLAYLARFALPNFYFHAATAYDILRHNGVEIGKRDFVGPLE